MEENTVIEQGTTQETPDQEGAKQEAKQEKLFTQEEVNGFFNKRYSEMMSKLTEYEGKAKKYDEIVEANKSELQKATEKATALEAELTQLKKAGEIREIREKVSKETGVPIELITAETQEACEEQAKAIAEFATPTSYPRIKDGGEPTRYMKPSTREQFSQWVKKAL